MRWRILTGASLLFLVLSLPAIGACSKGGIDGDVGGVTRPEAEAPNPSGETSDSPEPEDASSSAIAQLDVAALLDADTDFADAGLQDVGEAGVVAVATLQLAPGAKAGEQGVFAVLSAMVDAAPQAPQALVEIWTPGDPDARFAQYVWDRGASSLERFEASVPASEFGAYAPVGNDEAVADPQGFDAGRTGAMTAVDPGRLKELAAGERVEWASDTP